MNQAILTFEKMHGLGNDFVLIDNRVQQVDVSQTLVRFLANRHTGVGFDQLLLVENSHHQECDAAYRFFNPDGSEAEQCGNGQRCISQYLHALNPQQYEFCISGLAGIMHSKIMENGEVCVNMGSVQAIESQSLKERECQYVSFGNPHLVTEVDDVNACDLVALNHELSAHFADGVNLEVVECISENEIAIRVHERGTGETLACGSGACAAAYAMYQLGHVKNLVKVVLPGGNLMIKYDTTDNNIYLTGAATHVFTGKIEI